MPFRSRAPDEWCGGQGCVLGRPDGGWVGCVATAAPWSLSCSGRDLREGPTGPKNFQRRGDVSVGKPHAGVALSPTTIHAANDDAPRSSSGVPEEAATSVRVAGRGNPLKTPRTTKRPRRPREAFANRLRSAVRRSSPRRCAPISSTRQGCMVASFECLSLPVMTVNPPTSHRRRWRSTGASMRCGEHPPRR